MNHRSTGPAQAPVRFLVIGAQKCGTTSLFEYLRHHPELYLPPQKEVGFFSEESSYARGWDWYASAMALGSAPSESTCGEVCVAYMSGTPDRRLRGAEAWPPKSQGRRPVVAPEDVIPRRIKRHLPDVKMICILRDPVVRCLSHYRMTVLNGLETRPFEDAVGEMLTPAALHEARDTINGRNGYIVRGEYFRILSGYWRAFAPEQVMVTFLNDLQSRPEEVLERICRFIGVDANFVPDNLGVRYRAGAVSRKVRGLDLYALQERLSRHRTSRSAWHALPDPARARISRSYERASFRVEMWNARRGQLEETMPLDVHRALVSHFRADSEALSEALGITVPWLEGWSQGPRPLS